MGVLQLDAVAFLDLGLRQLLTLRIAGTAATLLTFPQTALPLHQPSPFRTQRGLLTTIFSSGAAFSAELPGR